MKLALSIVSKPGHPDLAIASQLLQASGFVYASQLANAQALLWSAPAGTHVKTVAELLEPLQIDWCLHENEPKPCQVLLCDMDATLIAQECIDELAHLAGVGPKVRAITSAAMAGKLDFTQALRARVALLAGQPQSILANCWETRIHINAGAATLVATMNQIGAKTVLVSGGFTWFANRVAKQLGFNQFHANELGVEQQHLSGTIIGPILDGQTKLEHLQRLCSPPDNACVIGDGANDLLMVQAANLGIAYHGKPILEQHANGRIRHTDLTSALFFQGIAISDWVIRAE